MKKITLLFLFISAVIISGAQSPVLLHKKCFKYLPGVAPIAGDYIFMDKAEVSNLDWKEFLAWLSANDTALFNQMKPNTKVWESDKLAYGVPFVNHYFQHPVYKDYPLVGISHRQAVVYCQWRTERVMESEGFKKTPLAKIVYRLPTEEEWKQAAWGNMPEGSPYPWEGDNPKWENAKKLNGMARFNHSIASWNQGGAENMNTSGTITTPVYSYWPNAFGLYNMVGNVAEWTANQKALGGSWADFAPQCYITADKRKMKDTLTANNIGFRCIMEVLEFKPKYNLQPTLFSAKWIEKGMKIIPDTALNKVLYAFETTTTNADFLAFINLSKNRNVAHQNWTEFSNYAVHSLYGKHQAYAKYPVVNISFDAATAYCEWLTDTYNNFSKRKFKKVVFRLPTEMEWITAAQAGNAFAKYPLNGENSRNRKGCYLYNFSPNETKNNTSTTFAQKIKNRGVDGAPFIARADSYFPNNYGLYNCAGNVAEMLAQKGLAKGGSWLSVEEEILITAAPEVFNAANPTTGFRVFMEVLETF